MYLCDRIFQALSKLVKHFWQTNKEELYQIIWDRTENSRYYFFTQRQKIILVNFPRGPPTHTHTNADAKLNFSMKEKKKTIVGKRRKCWLLLSQAFRPLTKKKQKKTKKKRKKRTKQNKKKEQNKKSKKKKKKKNKTKQKKKEQNKKKKKRNLWIVWFRVL